jgi:hypothetical protein
VLLAMVLFAATSFGLLVEGAYPRPRACVPTLPETLRGQDLVTLLAAIALLWGGIRARRGSLAGHVVWLAVCLYVPYTYLMYVVAPYNDALLVYIAAIGLGCTCSSTGCSGWTPPRSRRRSSTYRDGAPPGS